MKYLPIKPLPGAVLIAFLLVVVAAVWDLREYSAAQELMHEQKVLSSQAEEYHALKTRWSANEFPDDLEYLKKHPALLKEEKRGGNVYLEFGNLSSVEFNRLSNKILNSMLVIKKLTLRRDDASKGVIIVEIES